jgi:cytochrome c2
MKNADFVWHKGKLDQFIADPDAVVRDNRMKPVLFGATAPASVTARKVVLKSRLGPG